MIVPVEVLVKVWVLVTVSRGPRSGSGQNHLDRADEGAHEVLVMETMLATTGIDVGGCW